MQVDETRVICFSPTLSSLRIGKAIAQGVGAERKSIFNITRPQLFTPPAGVLAAASFDRSHSERTETVPGETVNDLQWIAADTLAIFSMPAYNGHIPQVARERLQSVHGEGTPAVVCVLYGNRDYGDALRELATVVRAQGFVVVGAATFIAQHTFSTPEHPIAEGRPKGDDLNVATHFGSEVARKLSTCSLPGELPPLNVSHISRPFQPLWPRFRFLWQLALERRQQRPTQRFPDTDITSCTRCGHCARLCPTGAITLGEELKTQATLCIRCCACVKGCPMGSRSLSSPYTKLLSSNFRFPKSPQTLL